MNKLLLIITSILLGVGYILKLFQYTGLGNLLQLAGYIVLFLFALLVIRDIVMKVIAIITSIVGFCYLVINIILNHQRFSKIYDLFHSFF